MNWLSKLAIYCIEYYQLNGGGKELFSIDCNFNPSCSEYAKVSFHRFGFCDAAFLAVKRVCRCNQPDLIHRIDDPVPDILIRNGKKE